jgi:DNA (cytosine-5)-methyltransferase 1
MTAYYNEIDPYAAQWLRNLIQAGHIAPGDVDERSIVDVRGADLEGYKQCHFFAGIGGWSYALRLAGWDDNRPVWTGSCPCQPFSTAGKREGLEDSRHLWPYWRNLIAQRRPAIVFGEQVERAAAWLAIVRRDLVQMDYAMGAMPIEAACAGAEHSRPRLYFVADAAFQNDGSADAQKSQRQELEPRGRFRPHDAWGGTRRIAGRRLPNASVPLLAHAIPSRLDQYRAYGNAIFPQVAAEFIQAADSWRLTSAQHGESDASQR